MNHIEVNLFKAEALLHVPLDVDEEALRACVRCVQRVLAPGGHFRRGETLLKIDPTDYRLAVRQLATDVAKAESELQLEQGNRQKQADAAAE